MVVIEKKALACPQVIVKRRNKLSGFRGVFAPVFFSCAGEFFRPIFPHISSGAPDKLKKNF